MRKGFSTAKELYDALRPLQEKKGYFFNKDDAMTMALLEQLLVTKERYGYMACPCRLANGEYALDKDIICPCVYREEDVAEYGECFCGLYVGEGHDGKKKTVVPERRPPENIIF